MKDDFAFFLVQARFYWNFVTKEQFEVIPIVIDHQTRPVCLRQVINLDISHTSTIQSNTLFVKPSVLLGYDGRNQLNPQWGVRELGSSTLRGIPTNMFKSCFHVPDIQATVTAIYQVADVSKFQTYLPTNQSIILEMNVQVISDSGQTESYTYNVFRYTPNPSEREIQQALETPAGVFCPNRTNTLPLPSNLPERLSVNSEIFITTANQSIASTHQLVDQPFQFTRFDVWFPNPNGIDLNHLTELHDFGTGLSYRYNHETHRCIVDDIKPGSSDTVEVVGQPNLVQMVSALKINIDHSYKNVKRVTVEKPQERKRMSY
jgi:hypothetical protein